MSLEAPPALVDGPLPKESRPLGATLRCLPPVQSDEGQAALRG